MIVDAAAERLLRLGEEGRVGIARGLEVAGAVIELGGPERELAIVADGIMSTRAAFGPDGVAVFGGGGLTNEKAYQLGKFARVALRTPQIDYNGRWCMSSAASAGNRAFGVDRGLPFPLEDITGTDVLVLVGSNLAETMPPAARYVDELRERGGKVVVIDPRLTSTATRAALRTGSPSSS